MRKYFSLASGRAAGADIARAQLKRSSAENSDVGIAATPGFATAVTCSTNVWLSASFRELSAALRHIEGWSPKGARPALSALYSPFRESRRAPIICMSSSGFWGQKVGGFPSAIIPSSQQPYPEDTYT